MTKPTILFILLLFITRFNFAQVSNDYITEKIQEADEYILSENYHEALYVLDKLKESGSENANWNYKTGLCYLNTIDEKSKALPYLKYASLHISKSYNSVNPLETNAPKDVMLLLGDAYRNNNNFSEAEKSYKRFLELLDKSDTKSIDLVKRRIRECHIAKTLQENPVKIKWEHLESNINEGIANLNPVISADGNIMVFSRKMKFYDAIYISHFKEGKWSDPDNITTQLGSDGEFYPTSISSDGTKLLMGSYEMLTGQDIYESKWAGSRWSKRIKLDEGVNSNFSEINGYYSADGNTIFFASNRDKGYGGFDIYKSERRADNTWSRAINLGPAINTAVDEKSPRLLDNGNVLCFSSQSHLNMGGLDLFYISYPITAGDRPKNMGFPINTVNDDFSFYPVFTQNSAYIAKYDINNVGETDIYRVDYDKLSTITDVSVNAQINLTGVSNDEIVSLYILDPLFNDTLEQRSLDSNSTAVEFILYPGSFILKAKKSEMESETVNFQVPQNLKNQTLQIPLSVVFNTPQNILAENILTTDTIYVSNISFEFNSYIFKPEYQALLNKIARFMTDNPTCTLALTGYTDALGIAEYNKILSKKRADQVKLFLQNKGINADRMKTSGEGSTNFIAKNVNSNGSDNIEGRWFNRRVEFHFETIPAGIIIINKTSVPVNLR